MGRSERGRIQGDNIILLRPTDLPDGTEVEVYIEPVGMSEGKQSAEQFDALGFFGMRRDEMADSAAWVRKEREKWHQRSSSRG